MAGSAEDRPIEEDLRARIDDLQQDAVKGLDVIYQLNITGDNGGEFVATIKDGKAHLDKGVAPHSDSSITVSTQNWRKLAAGQMNPMIGYMTGQIKIGGSLQLAIKLPSLFGLNIG